MDKLEELASLTQAGYILNCNEHEQFYESALQFHSLRNPNTHTIGGIDWGRDIWTIQAYSRTPIVFFFAISNDVNALLDWCIAAIKEDS